MVIVNVFSSDPLELFPSFQDSNTTITNVLYIEQSTVIMSIGFPFPTGNGYIYTWIIDFQNQRYVRLVFTNVELNQMVKSYIFLKCKLLLNIILSITSALILSLRETIIIYCIYLLKMGLNYCFVVFIYFGRNYSSCYCKSQLIYPQSKADRMCYS